jgi:hypothetical protein
MTISASVSCSESNRSVGRSEKGPPTESDATPSTSIVAEPAPSPSTLLPSIDDALPNESARAIRTMTPHAETNQPGCAELRLPPNFFVVSADAHQPGGWSFPVPDVNGDGKPEIATTSTAYRSVTGDVHMAIHIESSPNCYRFVGVAFGTVVGPTDRFASLRSAGSLLVSSTVSPHRELAEYRLISGRLVLHRTRACLFGEFGILGCTAWKPAGRHPA